MCLCVKLYRKEINENLLTKKKKNVKKFFPVATD